MDLIGEKGYLMRRNFINNEAMKRIYQKQKKKIQNISNNNITNNKNSNYEIIDPEQEKLEKLIRKKKIDLDKEIDKVKINLKKRLLKKLNKKNLTDQKIYQSTSLLNTERTKDLSSSSLLNVNKNTNYNINNTPNNNKEKKPIKLNLSLKIIRKPKYPYKKTLSQLNELTDELGVTNKTERINYIYDKEKRIIYENDQQRDLHDFEKNNKRRLTLFTSTSKLNNYLIKDFNLNENDSDSIKKKIEIARLSFKKINKLKKKTIYSQSQQSLISDNDRDFYYNLSHNNTKSWKKNFYSEKEMKKVKSEYYNILFKEKLKKSLKVFEKIKNLNYRAFSEVVSSNRQEYNNLDRMIKIKRYKKKIFFEDMKQKKEKLRKNDDEVYLTLSKFQPSVLFNKHFKISTINQFKSVNGVYFGLPV